MSLHKKIQELKLRAAPINYSSTLVDANGTLKERESLLDQRIVEGYGCIWGSINLHNERFFKGCFARSIQENGPDSEAAYKIKLRDEHGRAVALFEKLEEDEIGLYFRSKPLDAVSWADDMLTQLRSKTINNFSNGFNYIFENNSIKWNDNDETIDVFKARLFEISATAIPSDMDTFAIRSLEDADELFEITEDFIKSLPRKNQLEARRLFARHKSLTDPEALEETLKALKDKRPIEQRGINYDYLINNL